MKIKVGEKIYSGSPEELEGLIEALEEEGVEFSILDDEPTKPKKPQEQQEPRWSIPWTGSRDRRGPNPTAQQWAEIERAEAEEAAEAYRRKVAAKAAAEDLPEWAVRMRDDLEKTIKWGKEPRIRRGQRDVFWYGPLGDMKRSPSGERALGIAQRIAAELNVEIK